MITFFLLQSSYFQPECVSVTNIVFLNKGKGERINARGKKIIELFV